MQNSKLERQVKKHLTGRSPLSSEGRHWTVVPSKKKKNTVKFPLTYSNICAESTTFAPNVSESISCMIGKFIVCCSDVQRLIKFFFINDCERD